jgi:hypothetical protein
MMETVPMDVPSSTHQHSPDGGDAAPVQPAGDESPAEDIGEDIAEDIGEQMDTRWWNLWLWRCRPNRTWLELDAQTSSSKRSGTRLPGLSNGTFLTRPIQCCLHIGECVQFVAVTEMFAGGIFSLGSSISIHCWLKYETTLNSIGMMFMACVAMVVLNSFDGSAAASDAQTRQKMLVVVYTCYAIMFLQMSWCIWNNNVAKYVSEDVAIQSQCYTSEFFTGIVVAIVATLLRFAAPAFSNLWSNQSYSVQYPTCHIYVIIGALVAASLGFVSGLFLQLYCMLYEDGALKSKPTQDPSDISSCYLVPLAYMIPLPFSLFVGHQMAYAASRVWGVWNNFLIAFIYVTCLTWPLVLYSVNLITDKQRSTSLVATLLIVISARISYCFLSGRFLNQSNFSSATSFSAVSNQPRQENEFSYV